MPPVKCAVIGMGVLGERHASILTALPQAKLTVCCDVDESAADRTPPGVRFTVSWEDVLAEADLKALVVTLPEHLHTDVVVAALDQGLHVFCEKPLATSLEDAARIIAAEDASAATLVVAHVLRFDPRYIAVHDAVHAGDLGQPVHVVTRRNDSIVHGRRVAARTTLPMYLSVHDLDVMQWILASRVARVYAEGVSKHGLAGGNWESVVATLRFADGTIGLHETSWVLPAESGLSGDFALSVVGTEGAASVSIRQEEGRFFGFGKKSPAATGSLTGPVRVPDAPFLSVIDGIPFGLYRAELEHFLTSIERSLRPRTSSRDAAAAVAAALAIEESLASGRPADVAVEPLGVS